MNAAAAGAYRFDRFAISTGRRVLERGGDIVPLPRRSTEALLVLLADAGRLVTKTDLLQQVWPDVVVEENSLNQAISSLRRAMGDDAAAPRFIETVPGRGYRFIHAVSGGERLAAQPSAAPSRPALAVLPFRVLPPDPDAEFLSLGLADALIGRLSRVADRITVRPLSAVSAMTGAAAPADVRLTAAQLEVGWILEGSLRRAGYRLLVSAHLVRATDGGVLWAERFDERATDLFSLEERIAERLAGTLALGWLPELGASARPTPDAEAYLLYLQGRQHSSRLTRDGFERGLGFFRAAIRRDPRFAGAYEGLAYHYIQALDLFLPPAEAIGEARAAAERALELDPRLAGARCALGALRMFYDWDWPAAEREYRLALETRPDSVQALRLYGWGLTFAGRANQGLELILRAAEFDPSSIDHHCYLAPSLHFARRHDEAEELASESLRVHPDFWLAHVTIGRCREARGEMSRAIEAFEAACRLGEASIEPLGDLGRALARAGETARARALLGDLEARREYVAPFILAAIHLGLGDFDACFAQLEAAYAARSWYLLWLAVAPCLDPLRGDARFDELTRRVGFAR